MKCINVTSKFGKVLVDDKDYERVSKYRWWVVSIKTKRAIKPQLAVQTEINGKTVKLHRFILNPPKKMDVDHINGNTLDNRRSNLRICSRTQNLQNTDKYRRRKGTTSKFKGVSWRSDSNNWRARIQINGVDKVLGSFQDEISAARAYNKAALTYFGEFAKINKV